MSLITLLKQFTKKKTESEDVKDIRTLLISNERASILSSVVQRTAR